MNILKYALAIIAGIVLGGVVNMGLIILGPAVIAPPAGADMTTMEGLKASMALLEPRHFIFPFLAHAIGTFAGALVAAKIAPAHKLKLALVIGLFFLVGGIINIISLPSPIWFTILDLVLAYMPASYLAYLVLGKKPLEHNMVS